jgi:hypothetical protein
MGYRKGRDAPSGAPEHSSRRTSPGEFSGSHFGHVGVVLPVALPGHAVIRLLALRRGAGHVHKQIPLLVTAGASPVMLGIRFAHHVFPLCGFPLWGEASAQRRAAIV